MRAMNPRDERALQPAPECCRTCAHCTEWKGTTGTRHDCLKRLPMHPECAWQSPKTESLINPITGARPQSI